MITFNEVVASDMPADYRVELSYHQRVKGRLRVQIAADLDAGIVSSRGEELRHGDKLADASGNILEILAIDEPVSVAQTDSELLFCRACYHVGNRHAEVQIEAGRLVYLRDHVLDEMLNRLGLEVTEQQLPFSPESGAYSEGHSHSHSDHHTQHQAHSHSDRSVGSHPGE